MLYKINNLVYNLLVKNIKIREWIIIFRGNIMISTVIRVASIVLLILIFSNIWAQKRAKEEQQNKKSKK